MSLLCVKENGGFVMAAKRHELPRGAVPDEPLVGMVIREDQAGSFVKRIVGVYPEYIHCRVGWDGSGRKSRIKRANLSRYEVLR